MDWTIYDVQARSNKKEERAKYLIELRKKLDLTQSEMAKYCGVSKRTLEAWENKKQVPKPVTNLLQKIQEQQQIIKQFEAMQTQDLTFDEETAILKQITNNEP